MALRTIVQDGDPILKKVCRPVTNFDARLHTLLDDMKETLRKADGYGLAGPQVGVMRRLFITLDERDAPRDEDGRIPEDWIAPILEYINPEILWESPEKELQKEGCLSFPGQSAAVRRAKAVRAKAQDRNGNWFTIEVEGLMARCICHENNHLDGITIMDVAENVYEDEAEYEEE